jgi:hypothetical protein
MNTNNKQRLVDFLDELIEHIKSDKLTDIQSRKLGEFYISMVNNTYETEEEKNIKYYMLGYHIYKNLLKDIL